MTEIAMLERRHSQRRSLIVGYSSQSYATLTFLKKIVEVELNFYHACSVAVE
jgi:hypothetical protein